MSQVQNKAGVLQQKLMDARLYCVTQPPKEKSQYLALVQAALAGGAEVIQLRDKALTTHALVNLGRELKALCEKFGALFIVNDRVDAALACGADGVHLGQDDLPLVEARRIVQTYSASGLRGKKKEFIFGVSTHSIDQALKAEREGASYVGCGPLFATPTKPDYKAVGLELVQAYREQLKIPFAAIGGIDLNNARSVVEAGARLVAVVRAVFESQDSAQVKAAVESLKHQIMLSSCAAA